LGEQSNGKPELNWGSAGFKTDIKTPELNLVKKTQVLEQTSKFGKRRLAGPAGFKTDIKPELNWENRHQTRIELGKKTQGLKQTSNQNCSELGEKRIASFKTDITPELNSIG